MLRGGGYLEPLLLLLLLLLLLPALVASATASATCDEDQRARRDACETELEEAAASYLFTRWRRHPPSSLLRLGELSHDRCTQEFPRMSLLGSSVNRGIGNP